MKPGDRLVIYETGDYKSAVDRASVVAVDDSDPRNPRVKIKTGASIAKPATLAVIKANNGQFRLIFVQSGRKKGGIGGDAEDDYSLRFSIVFQTPRYRDTSTDHSCCGARINLISSAVPYPRSKAAAETSQLLNSVVFHRLGAALHRQYKMYSSQQPSIMGSRYESLS